MKIRIGFSQCFKCLPWPKSAMFLIGRVLLAFSETFSFTGSVVKSECRSNTKTICKPCTEGKDYMDKDNYKTSCLRCNYCDAVHGMYDQQYFISTSMYFTQEKRIFSSFDYRKPKLWPSQAADIYEHQQGSCAAK